MYSLALIALVALCLTVVVRAEEAADPDVVVLTSENFQSTIDENEFVLVEFYAPWCGHCKKLAPEYQKAAKALKDAGSKVVLGKVDATVESDLASKFGVRGYPTLKFSRNGNLGDYSGGRVEKEIVAWVTKKSGPASTDLENAEAVAEFVKEKNAVVGTFKSRESDAYKAFLETAQDGDLDDFAFASVVGDDESVKLYTTFTDAQTFNGEGELKEFVLNNGYKLVDELPEAWARYSAKGLPLAILFIDPSADNAETIKKVEAAAEQVRGKFSFSFADGVRFAQQIDRMGGSKDLPSLAAMKLNGKSNYPYDGELEAEALQKWAEGIVDGSIVAKKKSEAVPEPNDAPVTVVVGKNFDDIVLDAKKDVLLEVYAPWCGHCKSLAPIYEELGEKYKDNAGIVIAKVDGTANDIDVEFSGFPTLKFFPAKEGGLSTVQDYKGGRTLDDLVKYIEENAVNAKAAAGEEAKDEL